MVDEYYIINKNSKTMKIISNLKNLAVVAALIFGAVSCSDDDDGNGGNPDVQGTIAVTAATDTDLTSLVAALERVNLVATLDGNGPFTVLAPTNEAFAAFLQTNGFDSLDAVPDALLTQVLLNHVIAGEVKADDLETGYGNTLATYNGEDDANLSIYINAGGAPTFNGVGVVDGDGNTDIEATNGVIHKVTGVINLPVLATFALLDQVNFSSLLAAVQKVDADSELNAGLTAALSSPASTLTVLAPTNDAFAAALQELGFDSLNDVPNDTLLAILQAHIIGSVVREGDLTNGDVPTLNGNITIDADAKTVIGPGNDAAANIALTNVTAINGVAHAIDAVILPEL